jgi:hypothetical protein
MPVLCLSLARPGPQLRALIVNPPAVLPSAPGETTPLVIGSARPMRADGTRERAR